MAAVVLDAQCCVIQFNDTGLRWLSSELPPSAYRDGRLRCLGEKSAPTLQEAMLLCRFGVPVRLAVRMAGAAHAVVGATLIRLAADRESALGAFSDARYLLLIEMPQSSLTELASRVGELFDLSRAEMRVLLLLLEGCSAADMTQRTGTSMATVRSHIRSIFGKTEVTRQIDLMRLLRSVRI